MLLARPAWITVDLGSIQQNLELIRQQIGAATSVLAVVKSHAYGHGAVPVAKVALASGARILGVTCLDEAIELRNSGITADILMLGYTPAWQANTIVAHNIITTAFDPELLEPLYRASVLMGRPARVHIKVDTGMSRLGPLVDDIDQLCDRARALSGISVEGLFTHFATADAVDSQHTREQLGRFTRAIEIVRKNGLDPQWIHAANSAAMFRHPESHFNLVRPGAALYGLNPCSETMRPPGLVPALSFQALVAQVKLVPSGTSVSYGATWVAARPTKLAVLQAGYADGIRRAPQPWPEVLIRGKRAKLVGVICMDMSIADVTDIPAVQEGDVATFLGAQGDDRISVEEVAGQLGTLGYEVLTGLAPRVPRVYVPTQGDRSFIVPGAAEPLVKGVRTL
ncbi:MAG: alanine racemase [Chloroflexi bacterium]|nr:alanine racemase [Chloroflexota bacterium]